MKRKNMTPEEIREFNSNVDYNESAAGWVTDIICCIVFWPMIILVIRRRMKYREKIENSGEKPEQ